MSVVIIANGELEPEEWVMAVLREATVIVAADGGANHLLSIDRLPDVAIGDFDSIDPAARRALEAAGVKLIVHPEDKDESDLELALRYAAQEFDAEVMILGALGGRLDQLLANIFLLMDPSLKDIEVKIVEQHQQAWVVDSSESTIKGSVGDLVSLLPLNGDVMVERTEGLQWPLSDETLLAGRSRGISNVMTADVATVAVKAGMLLCIHTSREWGR